MKVEHTEGTHGIPVILVDGEWVVYPDDAAVGGTGVYHRHGRDERSGYSCFPDLRCMACDSKPSEEASTLIILYIEGSVTKDGR